MRILACIMLAAVAVLLLPFVAFAQESTSAVSPTSQFYDIWTIVSPLVTTIGYPLLSALGSVILIQIIGLLRKSGVNVDKQVEEQIRTALHSAAFNGLKFVAAKYGIPITALATLSDPKMINEAIEYIRSKSPDTAKQAGVTDADLKEIVLSKVPDVGAVLAAANGANVLAIGEAIAPLTKGT